MSLKLLWSGLTLIMAVNPVLALVGLHGNPVIVSVGAVVMLVGCTLYIMDR